MPIDVPAPPDESKVNPWPATMAELADRGWTQRALREYLEKRGVNCGQATLSDLARGKSAEPSFTLGTALVKLHASKRKPAVRTTL